MSANGFKQVLETIASVIVTDVNEQVNYISDVFLERLGKSKDYHGLGKKLTDIFDELGVEVQGNPKWKILSEDIKVPVEYTTTKGLKITAEITKIKSANDRESEWYFLIQEKAPVSEVQERLAEALAEARLVNKQLIGREIELNQNVIFQDELIKQLSLSESRIASFINNTNDNIWAVDLNYEVTLVNNSFVNTFYQLFNYNLKEGDIILQQLPESIVGLWKNKYDRTFAGETWEEEQEFMGTYLNANFNPIKDSNGEVVGASVFLRDITPRKISEQKILDALENEQLLNEQLAQREEVLSQNVEYQKQLIEEVVKSEASLMAVLNSTTDMIYSVDRDWRIIEFNQAYAEIVKLKSNKQVVKGMLVVDVIRDEHQELHAKRLKEAFEGDVVNDVVVLHLLDNSQELYIDLIFSPVFSIDHTVVGVTIIARDVTLRVNAEQKVIEALENERALIQKITQSEAGLSAIINSTSDLIFSVDLDYNIIEFNTSFSQLIDVEGREKVAKGVNILDAVREEHKPIMTDNIINAIAEKKLIVTLVVFPSAIDDNDIYMDTSFSPIFNVDTNEVMGVTVIVRNVTESKLAEKKIVETLENERRLIQQLAKSEASLMAVLNSSPDIIFSVDSEYRISEFNQTYAIAIKMEAGKDVQKGISIFDVIRDEHQELHVRNLKKSFDGEVVREHVVFTSVIDQSSVYIDLIFAPIYTEDKKIEGVTCIARNVTESKLAEKKIIETLENELALIEKIVESESRLKAILDSSPDNIFSVDKEHHLTVFNFPYAQMTQYEVGRMPEKGILVEDLLRDEHKALMKSWIDRALMGERVTDEAIFVSRIDNSNVYVDVVFYPMYAGDQKEIIGATMIAKNITERKNAAQKIVEALEVERHLNEQLAQSQAGLSAIINSTSDVVFSIDKEYKVLEYNNAFIYLTKIEGEQEVTQGADVRLITRPEHRAIFIDGAQQCIQESKTNNMLVKFESKIDASDIYLDITFAPIFEGKNQVVAGVSVIVRNVTESKEAEKIIVETLEKERLLLQKIAESEAGLKAILNSTSDMIFSIDSNYKMVEFNQAYAYALKLQVGLDVEKGGDMMGYVRDEHKELFEDWFRRAFEGDMVNDHLVFKSAVDESLFYVNISFAPIFGEEQKVVGVTVIVSDVTESKNAELKILETLEVERQLIQKIAKSEASLIAVLNSTSDMIFSVDKDYRITEFNNAYYQMVHHEMKEAPRRGEYFTTYTFEQHQELFKGYFNRVFQGELVHELVVFKSRAVEEETYYMSIVFAPIFAEDRQVTGATVIARNVTDEKRNEQKVREALEIQRELNDQLAQREETLKINVEYQEQLIQTIAKSEAGLLAILNSTPDLIYSVDKESKVTEFNQSFAQIVAHEAGFTVEKGRHILDLIRDEHKEITINGIRMALAGESSSRLVAFKSVLEEEKDDIYVDVDFAPIFKGEDKEIIGVTSIIHNVTESKRAEQKIIVALENQRVLNEQLAQREEVLKRNLEYQEQLIHEIAKSEASLSAVLNSTTDMIVSIDTEYKISEFNESYSKMIQYDQKKEVEKGRLIFEYSNEEYHKILLKSFAKVFQGEFVSELIEFTPSFSPTPFYVSTAYAPVFSVEQEVIGATIIARDITETKLAEQKIVEMNKQMAEHRLMALRSVMNPHFLFNSLNSIQYFISKNDRILASNYLSLFSKLIRKILDSSVNNKIPLSTEIDILRYYVDLEMLRFEHRFESQIIVDDNLDTDNIQIPSLLIQPYVENAILHGLVNREDKGNLKITIRGVEKALHIVVEDDGVGREAAQLIKSKKHVIQQSYGMLVTQERLDIINKTNNISVNIVDLVDATQQPSGTRVEIIINF